MADTVGVKLVKAWDNVIDNAKTYAAIVGGISVATAVTPGGGMGGPGVGAAAAGSGGRGILGVLKAAGRSFGRFAGPIAIVTLLLDGLIGAFAEYPRTVGRVTEKLGFLWDSFGLMGTAFGTLAGEGSILTLVGAGLLEFFGGLVKVLGYVVRLVGLFALAIGTLGQVIGIGLQQSLQMISSAEANTSMDKMLRDNFAIMQALAGGSSFEVISEMIGGGDGTAGTTSDPPVQNFTGDFHVKVQAEKIDDPNRVAKVFRAAIADEIRNPTQARGGGLPALG